MVQDASLFSKQRCQALMSPFMVPHWTLISPGRYLDMFILSDPWKGVFTSCFLSGKVILSQSKFISSLSDVRGNLHCLVYCKEVVTYHSLCVNFQEISWWWRLASYKLVLFDLLRKLDLSL